MTPITTLTKADWAPVGESKAINHSAQRHDITVLHNIIKRGRIFHFRKVSTDITYTDLRTWLCALCAAPNHQPAHTQTACLVFFSGSSFLSIPATPVRRSRFKRRQESTNYRNCAKPHFFCYVFRSAFCSTFNNTLLLLYKCLAF